MSNGKLRPCGPLLQLVVVALFRIPSVGRSIDVAFSEATEQPCNTTYFGWSHLPEREHQQAGSLAGAAPC